MKHSSSVVEIVKIVFLANILHVVFSLVASSAKADQLVYSDSHSKMNEFAASAACAQQYWPGDVVIKEYMVEGDAPVSEGVGYSAWSWRSRTLHQIQFGGAISYPAEGESGIVVVKFVDPFEMYNIAGDLMTRGTTRTWYYCDTGVIVGAVVYLNDLYFTEGLDKCAMQLIVHEAGHSIGAIHTGNTEDVMYTSGATGCRYSLSVGDMMSAPYSVDDCHAELTREGDIYIPVVEGMAAELVHDGSYEWQLGSFSASAGSCSTVSVDEGLNLVLQDLRGIDVGYYAELHWEGSDTWSLWYAQ